MPRESRDERLLRASDITTFRRTATAGIYCPRPGAGSRLLPFRRALRRRRCRYTRGHYVLVASHVGSGKNSDGVLSLASVLRALFGLDHLTQCRFNCLLPYWTFLYR